MSKIKDSAKKLAEQAKKYGYEIKHTHALELVSQILDGTNRHVSLKNEKEVSEEMFFYGHGKNSWRMDKYERGFNVPFFSSHVFMVGFKGSELFDIIVADDMSTFFEILGEEALELEWIQVLSEKDMKKEIIHFKEDSEIEEDSEFEKKTIFNSILDYHKVTGELSFSLFRDYE